MSKARTRPIADLKADPANARMRRIDAASASALGYSLAEFGDLAGLVFNRELGVLVAGHQRIAELTKAGATTWRDEEGAAAILHPVTGESFPIRVVAWDKRKHRAAQIVANSALAAGEFTAEAAEDFGDIADLDEAALEVLRLDELRMGLQALADDASVPAENEAIDEAAMTDTKSECPKCGFRW